MNLVMISEENLSGYSSDSTVGVNDDFDPRGLENLLQLQRLRCTRTESQVETIRILVPELDIDRAFDVSQVPEFLKLEVSSEVLSKVSSGKGLTYENITAGHLLLYFYYHAETLLGMVIEDPRQLKIIHKGRPYCIEYSYKYPRNSLSEMGIFEQPSIHLLISKPTHTTRFTLSRPSALEAAFKSKENEIQEAHAVTYFDYIAMKIKTLRQKRKRSHKKKNTKPNRKRFKFISMSLLPIIKRL